MKNKREKEKNANLRIPVWELWRTGGSAGSPFDSLRQWRTQLSSMRQPSVGEAVFHPQCDQPVGAAFRKWDLLRSGGALCCAALFHRRDLSS
jgi:hypothetical protein